MSVLNAIVRQDAEGSRKQIDEHLAFVSRELRKSPGAEDASDRDHSAMITLTGELAHHSVG